MPATVLGKNLMLDALKGTSPTTPITHVGLLTSNLVLTAVTSTGSPDTFTKTAHGLSNGDLVVPSALTGGTGLIAGDPYYVIGVAANTFQLALTPGGSAVDLSSDLTAGTITRAAELSGGSPAYARKAIAFAAAAGGVLDDSTNGAVVDVAGGANVDWVGLYSAVTAGTLLVLNPVTRETFAAQGTYTVTDAKVNALS